MTRKILLIIVMIVVLLGGLFMLQKKDHDPKQKLIYEEGKETQAIYSLNTVTVYRQPGGYAVSIHDLKGKIVYFYYDESFNYVSGTGRAPLKHLDHETASLEGIKTLNEMERILGRPFTDIGSGFYIPAYITDNGCILCFSNDSESIVKFTCVNLSERIREQ